MTLIYPVGLARSYITYSGIKFLPSTLRGFLWATQDFVSLILRHTVLHTDINYCILDFIKVIVYSKYFYTFLIIIFINLLYYWQCSCRAMLLAQLVSEWKDILNIN